MIFVISSNDYANFGHGVAQSLRECGQTVVDFTRSSHPFGYKTQSKVARPEMIIDHMKRAEHVLIMHSDEWLFQLAKKHAPGKISIFHTGTRYREQPDHFNKLFAGHLTFTDQTEFMELGPHKYVFKPVETEVVPIKSSGQIIVGHYPSDPDVKGTAEIVEMMDPFFDKCEFRWSLKKVSHEENLKRIADCDVYIELFKPELNGKKYGCFGVTAVESAMMGKIVFTQNLFPDVYSDAFGECPFVITNDRQTFRRMMNFTLNQTRDTLRLSGLLASSIADKNHSMKATGERILKFLNQ